MHQGWTLCKHPCGKVGSKGNASLRQQHDQQNNLLSDNDKEEEDEEDSVEELKTNCVSY